MKPYGGGIAMISLIERNCRRNYFAANFEPRARSMGLRSPEPVDHTAA